MKGFALIVLSLWAMLTSPPSASGNSPYEVRNRSGVYHGNADEFSKPVVLEAARVFDQIPEYQEIKRRHLTKDVPEYGLLLERANRHFFRALFKVARRDGYDLIAETGAVVDRRGTALKDVTDDAIRALEE